MAKRDGFAERKLADMAARARYAGSEAKGEALAVEAYRKSRSNLCAAMGKVLALSPSAAKAVRRERMAQLKRAANEVRRLALEAGRAHFRRKT